MKKYRITIPELHELPIAVEAVDAVEAIRQVIRTLYKKDASNWPEPTANYQRYLHGFIQVERLFD